MKEEEEVKKRKEAAARRMAEAKARAEVSVQFSFSLLTIIDPSSSYLSKANEQTKMYIRRIELRKKRPRLRRKPRLKQSK